MGLCKSLLVNILLVVFYSFTSAQEFAFKRSISRDKIEAKYTHLKTDFGTSKKLTNTYSLQCLYALSYFEELKDTKIEFAYKKIKTTMACRPRWDFLFRKKENRTYRIYFNSDTLNSKKVTFNELGFNAQIGVLGHEYSHIIDYMDKSALDLILYGFLYLTKKVFKEKLEKKIDNIAINRGLGWQIHDFSQFVLNKSSADNKYKEYKATYYYTPNEITNILGSLKPEGEILY